MSTTPGNNKRRDFLRFSALAAPSFALAACGGDDDDAITVKPTPPAGVSNPNSTLSAETGRTAVLTMLVNAPGGPGFDITPLVSAGDELPLLTGTFPDLQPHAELTYGLAGDPDGMGLMEAGGYYYVWLNHELVGDASEPEDFQQTIFSRTVAGVSPGARVSLIKFSKDWKAIGAMPLVRAYQPTSFLTQDDGTSPRVPAGSSIAIDLATKRFTKAGYIPSDFCGAVLAESGFVDPLTGLQAPVFFANEENAGYSGVAWACLPDGNAYPIEGLGIYEKETTVPLRSHRPKIDGTTILVGSEDDTDGHIYLWIGQADATDRNGFVNGELYAMKVEGSARESGPASYDNVAWAGPSIADAASTIGTLGSTKRCSWVRVPKSERMTRSALADFLTGTDANGATRATAFLAPEDINEDATVANRLWLAADGGADSLVYDDEGPRYENPLSRLYRIDLGIVATLDPATWNTTITYALEGGAGKGVSYDNVAPDSTGKILLSEDWDQGSDEADAVWAVLKQERRAPALYLYDIASGGVTQAFLSNAAQHDPSIDWAHLQSLIDNGNEATARDDFNFWEASGMIEVPQENRNGRAAYLIGVQAHSFKPSGYEEGGQLLLCVPKT